MAKQLPQFPATTGLTGEMCARMDRLAALMGTNRSEFMRVAIGEAVMRLEGGVSLPDFKCQHPVGVKDDSGHYCGICGKGLD